MTTNWGEKLDSRRKVFAVENDAKRGGIGDQFSKLEKKTPKSQENEKYFYLKCLSFYP